MVHHIVHHLWNPLFFTHPLYLHARGWILPPFRYRLEIQECSTVSQRGSHYCGLRHHQYHTGSGHLPTSCFPCLEPQNATKTKNRIVWYIRDWNSVSLIGDQLKNIRLTGRQYVCMWNYAYLLRNIRILL